MCLKYILIIITYRHSRRPLIDIGNSTYYSGFLVLSEVSSHLQFQSTENDGALFYEKQYDFKTWLHIRILGPLSSILGKLTNLPGFHFINQYSMLIAYL